MLNPTTNHEFDLIVIGAGSGGLATSKRAAAHGAKVAIVETSRVGGTCVIRGCIPKKLMVYASQLGHAREIALDYGWKDQSGPIDWERLRVMRDNVVANLEAMHQRNLAKANVTLFEGHARFLTPESIQVGEQTLRAPKVVIATGAAPMMPEIPGIEHTINSDGFWSVQEQPKRAVVIGGGYIALELACALQGLGTQTTLLVRSQILRQFDQEIAEHLETSMVKSGMKIIKGVDIQKIEKVDTELQVYFRGEELGDSMASADAVTLVATGRKPNTDGLGLETIGVKQDDRGAITVTDDDETNVSGVFAIGDVTLRPMLTPVAIKAGRILAERLFNDGDARMDYSDIPTAIFSQPPVGSVGLSEKEAIEEYGDSIKVFRSEFGGLMYSPTPKERTIRCMMKMVVHTETDKVLGCHMVGPDAPEIIQGFATAIKCGATKADFDRTVAIHPSSAEEFVLMS